MSRKIYVGTGGWYDYSKEIVSPNLRLKAYAKKFDFVEVNSTFYRIFPPITVERWRKLVPDDFQFSVKCYKALTHVVGLRPVEDAVRTMSLMLSYCKILNAQVLVLETPASLALSDKFVKDAKEFFSTLSLENARIAWEFRRKTEEISNGVANLLRDLDIIHVVDLTWENPLYDTDILYTRVFGNPEKGFVIGKEGFSKLEDQVKNSKSKKVYVSTHGLRMVQDAERIEKALGIK